MSRETMQMALEALDSDNPDIQLRAAIALRQALKTEQEPVAWISEGGDVSRSKRYMDEMGFKCNPLYTAPPKREWVGLTHPQIHELDWPDGVSFEDILLFVRAIEQALKEKNHGS